MKAKLVYISHVTLPTYIPPQSKYISLDKKMESEITINMIFFNIIYISFNSLTNIHYDNNNNYIMIIIMIRT